MIPEAFADYLAVENRWPGKRFSVDEQTAARTWLEEASGIIRDAAPTIDERIASGAMQSEVVGAVAASMVLRRMQNLRGLRQFSDSIDDRQESGTFDAGSSVPELYLTDRELQRIGAQVRRKAFTISPGIVGDAARRRW